MAKATLVRHELPPLPYAYDALEPHYDRETLQLHHDKHHKAYVEKLNHALEKHEDLASKEVEDLLRDPDAIPRNIRSAVMNNAGGHFNHSFFCSAWRRTRTTANARRAQSAERST